MLRHASRRALSAARWSARALTTVRDIPLPSTVRPRAAARVSETTRDRLFPRPRRRAHASRSPANPIPPLPTSSQPTRDFPGGEPSKPEMRTTCPGPNTLAARAELDAFQETGALRFVVDVENSRGCYVRDVDGNVMLDMFSHIASLPFGYNHPTMLEVFTNPRNVATLAHRPALFNLPPAGYAKTVRETLMSGAFSSHWSPYDRVGVVHAAPRGLFLFPAHLSAHHPSLTIPTHLDAFQLRF